jgi:hypothetical protein
MKNTKINLPTFDKTPVEKTRNIGRKAKRGIALVTGAAALAGGAHIMQDTFNSSSKAGAHASAPLLAGDWATGSRSQMVTKIAGEVMQDPRAITTEQPASHGEEQYLTRLQATEIDGTPVAFTVVTGTKNPNSVQQVSEEVSAGPTGGQPGSIDFIRPGVAEGQPQQDWTVSSVSGDGYGGSFETNIVGDKVETTDTSEPHAKPTVETWTPSEEFTQDASQVMTDLDPNMQMQPSDSGLA